MNNKNKIIEQQNLTIANLNNQLNNLNNLYNNNLIKIKNLENMIKEKEIEYNKFKQNIESSSNNSNYKIGFAVNFRSINQEMNYPMVCNDKDIISRLEEELYNEYPEFKDYDTFLTCSGKKLKRFKTIKENGIKKGDTILVNIIE